MKVHNIDIILTRKGCNTLKWTNFLPGAFLLKKDSISNYINTLIPILLKEILFRNNIFYASVETKIIPLR